MIDEEAHELGKRAVACKGWRWMPGMLAMSWSDDLGTVRVYHPQTASRSPLVIHYGGNRWDMSMHGPYLPDLRDPCTLGGLLALVREAWGDPTIHLTCVDSLEAGQYDLGVRSVADKWSSDLLSDSEAEALVAALEEAP